MKGGKVAGGKLGGTLDVILRSCATWGWEGLGISPPQCRKTMVMPAGGIVRGEMCDRPEL